MKVVFLSRAVYPFHGYGGMERYIYFLGKYIKNQGIDLEFVTSTISKTRMNSEVYKNIKFNFIGPALDQKVYPSSLINIHRFYRNVSDYLKNETFDILHSFGGAALFYLAQKERKPTIVQTFGNEVFKTKGLNGLLNYILLYPQSKYMLHHADAVASEGDIQTEEIVELFGISKDKIFTLPDGIDLSQIDNFLLNTKVTRESIGLKDSDFIIISVNRFDAIKGLNYLIEAYNIIKKEIENAKLILIGTGPEEKRLKNQINKLGLSSSVLHFKNVDDSLLYNYLSLADVYVSPSLQNCLLLSVLEAMACRLPIVSTDSQEGAVREGVNGYIVPSGDSKAIANAVIKIYYRNELKRMGAASKEIAKNYDWEIIAKKAIKEYERIIGK